MTFGGTTIGTFTGGTNGTNLVITFNNNAATPAAVQALLDHILYSNSSSNPSLADRTVTYSVNDGDGGVSTGTATATIDLSSPNPFTLTGGTDTVSYTSGTNQVNGTNSTATNGDVITGGTGTDTLTITDSSIALTFGNGTGNIGVTNFETINLVDSANANHTDTITFAATFNNGQIIKLDGSGINGNNGKLSADGSATSNALNIIGSANADILKGGSGSDTINGGGGADLITGNGGADTPDGRRK